MMKLYAVRLHEGEDLKQSIEAFVTSRKLNSATVVSAVGSLSHARVRMAGEGTDLAVKDYDEYFEIVSLIGNLGPDRTHLHIAVANADGKVIGGHLKEDNIVQTTVELVLASDDSLYFGEEVDPKTGFDELKVREV